MDVGHYSKKIAKAGLILFLGMVLGRGLTYLYVALVSRLGSANYGLLSLGFVVTLFLSTFALLGLRIGIVRYISYFMGKKNLQKVKGTILSSIRLSLPLSLLLAILLFIFSEFVAVNIFHNSELTSIFRLFSITIPFITLSHVFLGAMIGFQRIEYQVGIKDVGEIFSRLLLTFILIYLGYGLFGVEIAYIISVIITFFLSFYFLKKKVFPQLISKVKPILIDKELFLFSFPLMFTGFLNLVVKWVDIFMIGIFRTASEVGIYNVALPTANLLVIVPTALMGLFMPVITELYSKKKKEDVKDLSKIISKWIFFANLPIFFLIFLFSKPILTIAFGSEYVVGYVALSVLLIGYLIASLSHTYSSILSMIKKTKVIMYVVIITTLINIILNYILIPKIGIVGGAIATSISLILACLFFAIYTYKFTKIQPLKLNYFKGILSGLIALLLIYYLSILYNPYSIFILFIFGLLFLAVYFVFLMLFKCLDNTDEEVLLGFFNVFKNKIKR